MALGLIEVFGFTTAVVVGDAVAKAGNVRIVALDRNKPAAGDAAKVPLVMMVKFEGGVAEVHHLLCDHPPGGQHHGAGENQRAGPG